MYKPTAEPDTVCRGWIREESYHWYCICGPAYDTLNDRVLLTKLYGMTEDAEFTKLIGGMLRNRRF